MGLRTCAIACTIGSRTVRLLFSALSSSSYTLPDWSNLPHAVAPAPLAPPEDIAVIPPAMPMHSLVPSVLEGIPVEPPSPQQLWGTPSRPPSLYFQHPQVPITPPPGPPRSHQSVYPPPPVPPPVGSAMTVPAIFGSPAEGGVIEPPSLGLPENIVIQPAAGAVIQPATLFPPPIVAPSDSHSAPVDPPRTRQSLRRGTPSPSFGRPGLTFGSPPVSMTHDRPSRRSPIIVPGSPHSSSRGSPGRPSRSYRPSRSPHRAVFVEGAPALPRSRRSHRDHQSRSPSPPVFGPQLPQPPVIVQSESRGRSTHRVPPRSTALDRPHSHSHSHSHPHSHPHSRSPSPERYRPHPSHRSSSHRPRSPIVLQQPPTMMPPMTGVQPPVMPIAPTAHPVTIMEPPHPRRLHRSHRHYSRTPSPRTPVIVAPPGHSRSGHPRSGSWDRPRHRRNFLQGWGRRRRGSYERPHSRGHYYDDYDAPDRDPRYHYPSRHHGRPPSRLRRSSRSLVRSHSYSPEPRHSHRRRGSYQYSDEELPPPRTSRRSHRTFISGAVPHSSRRGDRSPSPSVLVTQGEHVGRSYQRPTLILPGDDHPSPSRSPISIAPSRRLTRAPSIEFVPPSLHSERLHEWEAPHPLVSALYL